MTNDMTELYAQAKERGINTFQMSKADIQAALDDRQPREEKREEPVRRKRVPLGSMTLKLGYASKPGHVRRWMNDAGGRISAALEAGYDYVKETHDGRETQVSRRVGVNEDGSALMAYLMEILQEYYNEDQATKQGRVDQIDAAIKGGEQRGNEAEQNKFYTPAEGVSMQSDNS